MNRNMTFSLALIAGALVAGVLLNILISLIIKKRQEAYFLKEVQVFFRHLQGPLKLLVPALCLMPVISLAHFQTNIRVIMSHVLELVIIAGLGWLAVGIIHAVRDVILSRYDITARDNLLARRIYTQTRVIEHMLTIVVIFLTIAFMLLISPKVRQIGVSLLASAGVAGIILGFAAQKTLGNFIAGIQLAVAQPIRIDDVVIIEGEWGWIEEITLTYVVVRIWDLRRLVVPISYFVEKPFQNWTRTSADILGSVFIYADYTVDVGKMREELTRILNESLYWDKKVKVLQVTNATERVIELRALMSSVDSPTAWNLRCEVREKLLMFLQENYPKSLPRVRVDTEKAGSKKT